MNQSPVDPASPPSTVVLALFIAASLAGCSESQFEKLSCGPGTRAEAGVCLPVISETADAGATPEADIGVTCGAGTHLEGDLCLPDLDATVSCAPGTHLEGLLCVVDAASGNALLLPKNALSVFRGGLLCLDGLTVLHADGSTDPALATSAVVADSTLATLADPGDCTGIGFIGISAGHTMVSVTANIAGESLSAPAALSVDEVGGIALSLGFFVDSNPIGVGGTGKLQVNTSVTKPNGAPLTDGILVPRWIDVSSADATLAQASKDVLFFGIWDVTGIAPGTTTLTASYGPPWQTFNGTPVQVQVVSGGTLVSLRSIALTADDNVTPVVVDPILKPPSCLRAHLIGRFLSGNVSYYGEVPSGIAWSSRTLVLQQTGDPNRFCTTGSGDAWLVGCVASQCAASAFPVNDPGQIKSVTAALLDSSTVIPKTVAGQNVFCPPVHATATFSDGSTESLNSDPAAHWSFPPGGPWVFYQRALQSDGTPVNDAQDDPCFLDQGQLTTETTITVIVSYAGSQASVPFVFKPR